MRSLARLLVLAAALLGIRSAPAWAESAPGRIVIEGAGDLRGHLEKSGDVLHLAVGKRRVHLVLPHAPVHDVLHVVRRADGITIKIRPGAVVQTSAVDGALVIELSDPPIGHAAVASGPAGAATNKPAAAADALIPGLPDGMVASIIGVQKQAKPPTSKDGTSKDALSKDATSKVAASAPASPKPASAAPVASPAAGIAAPAGGVAGEQATAAMAATDDCLMLPASHATGIAMYRRGFATVIVIDRSVAPPSDGNGSWWQAHRPQVTRAAEWTAVRVPTSHGEGIRIERQVDGLCLSGTSALPPGETTIAYRAESAAVSFALPHPGRTLTVIDPVTHALLLVGTDVGGAGELRPARRSALFAIDDTLAGVVVEPFSDRLGLHRTSDGFDLAMDGAPSIHVPSGFAGTAIASVDGLTRTLSLVDEPTDALTRRMRQRALAAATAPLRARSDRRLDLAEAMVALGLGSEARSVLLTAASDDPTEAASPRAALLAGIASVLDKRPAGADPFAAPNFPTTEEGKLWRALAWAAPAPLGGQAATIRRGMPLLLSYPPRLRDAAAAQAARVLLAGDDPDGIRAVDLLPDSDAIRLARARAAARLGHVADAIAALDRLARSRDLGIMADSLRDTIRLRLAAGQLTPAASADLLDAHRLDWRLTGQEAVALLEEADDRLRVPDLRAAFGLWHDAVEVDPTLRAQIDARRLAGLERLTQPGMAATVSASDFASIIAENADAIPAGSDLAARTGVILADKFAALGLDDHAATTLEPLAKVMPPGVARAAINTQLAALDAAQGDHAAATVVLARDDEASLPVPLLSTRRLVHARVLDAEGKTDDALALLAHVPDDEGLRLKANLLMERKDWHAAIAPLTELFHRFPAHGSLDAAQGAVALQLVAASVRDGAPSSSAAAHEIAPRLADDSERRSLEVLMAPLAETGARRNLGSASGI